MKFLRRCGSDRVTGQEPREHLQEFRRPGPGPALSAPSLHLHFDCESAPSVGDLLGATGNAQMAKGPSSRVIDRSLMRAFVRKSGLRLKRYPPGCISYNTEDFLQCTVETPRSFTTVAHRLPAGTESREQRKRPARGLVGHDLAPNRVLRGHPDQR